jgi:hypothetical protein
VDNWQPNKQQIKDLETAGAFVDKNLSKAREIASRNSLLIEGKDEHNVMVILRIMGELSQKVSEQISFRIHEQHHCKNDEPWKSGGEDDDDSDD